MTKIIQVNVAVAGTYNLKAEANGVVFAASGTIGVGNYQNITLTATGRPTAIGTHGYKLNTTPNCTFYVPTQEPVAVFTYSSCGGSYTGMAGTAGSWTHYITVNVTQLGTYSISAGAGGVGIRASGTFTKLGAQTVALTGSGTPSAGGTYTISLGSCSWTMVIGYNKEMRCGNGKTGDSGDTWEYQFLEVADRSAVKKVTLYRAWSGTIDFEEVVSLSTYPTDVFMGYHESTIRQGGSYEIWYEIVWKDDTVSKCVAYR